MKGRSTNTKQTPFVWTVGGSDCSAGAGIQADLKTFNTMGIYGCTLITAVTAQNTSSISTIVPITEDVFNEQLRLLAKEFMPVAIKSGMLASPYQAKALADFLSLHPDILFICDPVMRSSSRSTLCNTQTLKAIQQYLLPRASIVTPNVYEAHYLAGFENDDTASLIDLAERIHDKYSPKSVLIKGGHLLQWQAEDLWLNDKGESLSLSFPRVPLDKPDVHGTGCTLSAAITAALADGQSIENALIIAKTYITQSIQTSTAWGASSHLLNHCCFDIKTHLPQIKTNTLPNLPLEDFPPLTCSPGFYPIVDSCDWIEKLAKLGVKTLQLRMKKEERCHIENEICLGIKIAKRYRVMLFINDYWELAIKHKAYGVHLGQDDLEKASLIDIHQAGLRLGISTHDYYELLRATIIKPSYIALGPIFETKTKKMRFKPQGLKKLKQWRALVGQTPLVAIGGICYKDMSSIYEAGANGVAVVRYISHAESYEKNLRLALSLEPSKVNHELFSN